MNPEDYYRSFIADLKMPQFVFHSTWAQPVKTPEQIQAEVREKQFSQLDVQNGDIVELSYNGGTSTLQGPVAQVRNVGSKTNPEYQVRIEGFGETPHGNHNTWFAVRGFEMVKMIKRTFRWTPRDRAIVALLGVSDSWWINATEERRQSHREHSGARVDRIAAALNGEAKV